VAQRLSMAWSNRSGVKAFPQMPSIGARRRSTERP
jgi:hypothetical protein